MKNGNNNIPKGDNMFGIVLLAIILLIIFSCLFGWFCWKSNKTEEFIDERYFHYDNIGKLIPTDPPHVTRDVLKAAMMDSEEMDSYFGSAKKKTIS